MHGGGGVEHTPNRQAFGRLLNSSLEIVFTLSAKLELGRKGKYLIFLETLRKNKK